MLICILNMSSDSPDSPGTESFDQAAAIWRGVRPGCSERGARLACLRTSWTKWSRPKQMDRNIGIEWNSYLSCVLLVMTCYDMFWINNIFRSHGLMTSMTCSAKVIKHLDSDFPRNLRLSTCKAVAAEVLQLLQNPSNMGPSALLKPRDGNNSKSNRN